MCYHYSPAHLNRLKKLYPDKFKKLDYPEYANGFTHPKVPAATTQGLALFSWGLIPHWTKDWETAIKMRRFCLNAKLETLSERPSFRDALQNKQFCILPAESFYEWQWQDAKGKTKTKFEIKSMHNDPLYLGGLYSHWTDKNTGEIHETITIITCPANTLMEKIHNTKKRMPILLDDDSGKQWIEGKLDIALLQQKAQAQLLVGEVIP